jgi:hypothetical protein
VIQLDQRIQELLTRSILAVAFPPDARVLESGVGSEDSDTVILDRVEAVKQSLECDFKLYTETVLHTI